VIEEAEKNATVKLAAQKAKLQESFLGAAQPKPSLSAPTDNTHRISPGGADDPLQSVQKVEDGKLSEKPLGSEAKSADDVKSSTECLSVHAILDRINKDHGLEKSGATSDRLLPLLQLFKSRLEAFMFEATLFGRVLDQGITPDRGVASLLIELEGGRVRVKDARALRTLQLNFAGCIEPFPVVGALLVAKFAGVSFYVHPPKQSDVRTCMTMIPAWSIPCTPSKKDHVSEGASAKKKSKTEATPGDPPRVLLTPVVQEAKFRFCYPDFLTMKTEVVDVNVHALRLSDEVWRALPKDKDVLLERTAVEAAATKETVTVHSKAIEDKRSGSAGDKLAKEEKRKFLEDWPFPHLFR
jgi:hypothetical protein